MHALVIDGQILSVGGLPRAARDLDTGEWVTPPDRQWTDALAATVGYLPVARTPRPSDMTTDWVRSVEMLAGTPTEVWTAEPWTTEELAAQQSAANDATMRSQVRDALVTLGATADAMRVIRQKNNNQIGPNDTKDVASAVVDVAQQLRKVIRIVVGALDSTE